MICFLLIFRTQFAWWLGTVELLFTLPCVSLRAMKNGRRKADLFLCLSDIRKRKQKQFSRPMTGHTPQKLPRFRAISCIIAVRAGHSSPTRARLSYHRLAHLSSIIFTKYIRISTQKGRRFSLLPCLFFYRFFAQIVAPKGDADGHDGDHIPHRGGKGKIVQIVGHP